MVTRDELISVLGRVADETAQEHQEGVRNQEWRGAFEALLTSLIWRTLRLAIQIGISDHRINFGLAQVQIARLMLAHCREVLSVTPPSEDETSAFRKTEILRRLLQSLIDEVGIMENWTGGDPQEPFFVAIKAFDLGQAEVAMKLAEDGHWEQIAQWQKERGGRKEGYRDPWRLAVAGQLQEWIDENPKASIKSLMIRIWDWFDEYERRDPAFDRPDFESIRKAIKAMSEQGMIAHPRWSSQT